MSVSLTNLAYLVSSVLFILGLMGLTRPRTAIRGNLLAALAMLFAVVVTLLDQQIISYDMIIAGIVVGALIGVVLAIKIEMTAMPQLVALFNAFGGGASTLVAGTVLVESAENGVALAAANALASALSGLIGTVTFFGSLVAFGKLQGLINEKPFKLPLHQPLLGLLLLISVGLCVWTTAAPLETSVYWGLVVAATLLGLLLVFPIGGADMPVVIALLNSYSGLAACATGFVLSNTMLIIAGSLVGASGLILTRIMCQAMNRSLWNVLSGNIGPTATTKSGDEVYAGKVKSADAEEVAMVFENARRIIVVPGYGMAVAQAQFAIRDLAQLLEQRGIEVEFAIHPVAGRMPGHMNVLLAEANIDYDRLKDLDQIGHTFDQAQAVLVIGANDVVNPSARNDQGSPIYGMPIFDVDKAETVIVIKRSLSPGFAGIPNPLFALDNTLMLFGDGKAKVVELIEALKSSQ